MIQKTGVDTNAFLEYFLSRKDKKKIDDIIKKCIAGNIELYVALPVFLELEWVLRSYYKIPKEEIITIFESLFEMDNLVTDDKDLLLLSIELFKKDKSISFTDCIILNFNRKNKVRKLVTFDQRLKRKYSLS